MSEQLKTLEEHYRYSKEYLEGIKNKIDFYINDIESLKHALIGFKEHCEKIEKENNEYFDTNKKRLSESNSDNWSYSSYAGWGYIVDNLAGTHYLSYIKTHVKAFEGMSKHFRETLNE